MRKSEVLGRGGLICLGLVLALVGLELALQMGALVVAATGSEVPSTWVTGARRILCLGDSNTFGLYMAPRERDAYPGQLEALWRQSERTPPMEVLNAGYPGTNSSRLLHEFPPMVEALQPDLAIVMIGVNDFWTAPVTVEASASEGGIGDFLRRHSRVLRSYALLRRRFDNAQLDVTKAEANRGLEGGSGVIRFGDREFRLGWEKKAQGPRRAEQGLKRNLGRLVQEARGAGVELVLMTYPSSRDFYGGANRAIRRAAESTGTTLVDLESVFRPHCPAQAEQCPDWFFPDQHPRATGYRLIAETLLEQLSGPDG